MKNAVKLFLREWKYLLKRPRSLVLMVLVPIFVTCICGSGYGKGYFSDLKMGVVDTREIEVATMGFGMTAEKNCPKATIDSRKRLL